MTTQNKPQTPKFIFLALLSILTAQTHSVNGDSFWSYTPHLFRLAASTNVILQKRPNKTVSIPYAVRSCVSYPFTILLGHPIHIDITVIDGSYKIFCHTCRLTNYIDSILDKKLSVMILVKRLPYVMLPVDLIKKIGIKILLYKY